MSCPFRVTTRVFTSAYGPSTVSLPYRIAPPSSPPLLPRDLPEIGVFEQLPEKDDEPVPFLGRSFAPAGPEGALRHLREIERRRDLLPKQSPAPPPLSLFRPRAI